MPIWRVMFTLYFSCVDNFLSFRFEQYNSSLIIATKNMSISPELPNYVNKSHVRAQSASSNNTFSMIHL